MAEQKLLSLYTRRRHNMAIRISGTTGIDMGNTSVSNVDVGVLEHNAVSKQYVDLKQSKSELTYDVNTNSYIPNTLASGAIIERGSNANGEYIKYADGTMICTATLPNEIGYLWSAGTWFKSSNFPLSANGWTYPHFFSSVPIVHITSLNDNGESGDTEGILTQFYYTNNTKAMFDGKAIANIIRIIYIKTVAIGRWK